MEDSDFIGVGQLLKSLGEELEIIKDVLRCDEDSTVKSRYGADEEETSEKACSEGK
ncbi:MAG: hypothetical protein AB8E15_01455 [Bdellovibrionales bacterium]